VENHWQTKESHFSSQFQSNIQVRGAEFMCIFIWFVLLHFVLKLDLYVV